MASIDGTPNDDIIVGTSGDDGILGGSGNDRLFGEGGLDILYGGDGNDRLSGGDGNDVMYAHEGDDTLLGGAGNDHMRGGAGVDRYEGGADDGLVVESGSYLGDRVSLFNVDATRGAVADLRTGVIADDGFGNRETMTGMESLGGGTAFVDEFYGNDLANFLAGGAGDTLIGFRGDDHFQSEGAAALIDGGDGIDTILGINVDKIVPDFDGDGRADYVYANAGVTIDLMRNLLIDGFGDTGAIMGIENFAGTYGDWDDILYGDDNDNVIRGHGGADSIDGRGGSDTISYDRPGDHYSGTAVEVDLALGYSEESGLRAGTISADTPRIGRDVLAGIENIIGSGRGDRLGGDGANNVIAPGAGNDIVNGRGGIDTVDYSNVRSAVSVDLSVSLAFQEGTGAPSINYYDHILGQEVFIDADDGHRTRDWLHNIENVIGSVLADRLAGAAGVNRLDGGGGNDVIVLGLDGDVIVGGAGRDAVDGSAAAGAVVIDLAVGSARASDGTGAADRLYGMDDVLGSAFVDTIVGSARANRLDGGAGADRMEGGAGNDIYVVDDSGDLTIEAENGGTDRIESSISLTLRVGIEQLTLTGDADCYGFGNELANRIAGNDGANLLDGRAGADVMIGGDGNDAYHVDDSGDRIVERTGEGTDRVASSVAFTLGAHVENLTLTGDGDIAGAGNGLANIIRGNNGANRLDGGYGNDLLDGGAGDDSLHGGRGSDRLSGGDGADAFVFDALLRRGETDTILDFLSSEDEIRLDRVIFGGIAAEGAIGADAFRSGTAAVDADDRILYDSATGRIFYDADGSDAGAALLFARVTAGTDLSAGDFFAFG